MNDGSSRERSDWTLGDRAADLLCAAEVAARARLLATAAVLLWVLGLLGWACGAESWPWSPPGEVGGMLAAVQFLAEIGAGDWGAGRIVAAAVCGAAALLAVGGYWVFAARATVFELARGERISLGEGGRFVARKGRAWLGATALVVASAAGVYVALAATGLMLHYTASAVLVWVAAPLVAVLVVVGAFTAAGPLLALPLAWTAVSVDGSDAFDALTRGYSYAFQRPIEGVLHLAAAAAVGGLLCMLAAAVGWWVDATAVAAMAGMLGEGASGVGGAFIAFARSVVWLVVHAFAVSYAATATTWIYVWRRCDVDDASPDEMRIDDQPPNYELPPLADPEEPADRTPEPAGAPNGEGAAAVAR